MFSGQTVLLTGATDGIGLASAHMFAEQGADLLIMGKDARRGTLVRDRLIAQTGNSSVRLFVADFRDLSAVRQVVSDIVAETDHLDVIIANAAVFMPRRELSVDGFEITFAVNHLAHFFLITELLPLLSAAETARIVVVSSMIHAGFIDFDHLNGEVSYSGSSAYSLSKLCNLLFAVELAQRTKQEAITVNALHPGVIDTKLLRAGWGAGGASPVEGAKRILFLAGSRDVKDITGCYFMNDRAVSPAAIVADAAVRERLWNISEQMIKPFRRQV